MLEFGDHPWQIARYHLAELINRMSAATMKEARRIADMRMQQRWHLNMMAATHNAAERMRVSVAGGRARFITADDFLKPEVDEAAFRKREAEKYDHRLTKLAEQPMERITRLIEGKRHNQEGWRLRDAAGRLVVDSSGKLRSVCEYVLAAVDPQASEAQV